VYLKYLAFNRLFHPEKKGVWTKTLAYYTSYSFKDIEAVVKKLASTVVKSGASKNQVSFPKGFNSNVHITLRITGFLDLVHRHEF
jgi:hypothetical protein